MIKEVKIEDLYKINKQALIEIGKLLDIEITDEQFEQATNTENTHLFLKSSALFSKHAIEAIQDISGVSFHTKYIDTDEKDS